MRGPSTFHANLTMSNWPDEAFRCARAFQSTFRLALIGGKYSLAALERRSLETVPTAKQSRVCGVLRPARQKGRQFGISRELRHTGEGGTEPIATPDTRFSPSAIGVLRFGEIA